MRQERVTTAITSSAIRLPREEPPVQDPLPPHIMFQDFNHIETRLTENGIGETAEKRVWRVMCLLRFQRRRFSMDEPITTYLTWKQLLKFVPGVFSDAAHLARYVKRTWYEHRDYHNPGKKNIIDVLTVPDLPHEVKFTTKKDIQRLSEA